MTRWYVIRTVTGKEKKAKEQLDVEIVNNGFSDRVSEVIIPMEKVYHVRNGKKVANERNHYPGYVLIELEQSVLGEMKRLVNKTNFVVEFLGGNNPTPLRNSEVERILGKMDELAQADETIVENYSIGESIKVIDGPFNDFKGVVEVVNNEKKKMTVNVKIFGRSTPLELSFMQVEKEV